MRLHLAAPLAVLVLAAGAPVAQGAAVSIERSDGGTVYVSVLGGAEADALTVSSPASGRFSVTQGAGAPLTAIGNECAVVAAGRVDCTSPHVAGAMLVGGDGHDRLAVSGAVGQGVWIFGGGGNDDLTAGPGADRVDGGAGADVLRTRDGLRDSLLCGADDDGVDADEADVVAADCERRIAGLAIPAPVTGASPLPPAPAPLPVPVPATTPAPVDVSTAPVTLIRGAVPMQVSCHAATGCSGRIVVRLLPRRASRTAVASGARRPVIARQRYRVGAGESKSLRVHISRRGRTRVLARRKARCSVRITTSAADGIVQVRTRKITIKAGGGR